LACSWDIPETPSRNANGHDNIDNHLDEENEEEGKEVEGTVTPERKNGFIGSLNLI
jgi:hypothetical protein